MPDIIDIHAHVFPQNVFDKIWRYFDAHHWPIYYRQGEAERAAFLDSQTAAYTTLCYAHKPKMAAWLNDYVLAYAAQHPRAIAMGTFHPEDDDVENYVERGIAAGLKGFKLHLEVQRFDPADARLANVYAMLAEAGCVALVHTAGAPLEGPYTGPGHFERMLRMAPGLQVIVAHAGGNEAERYLALAERYDLCFDTAMVGVDYEGFGPIAEPVRRYFLAHPRRVLFGSDFPSIPYPWQHQVEVVRGWGWDEEGLALVFAGNARRLFRL